MLEVFQLTDHGEIVVAVAKREITVAGAVGRLVQLGRTVTQG